MRFADWWTKPNATSVAKNIDIMTGRIYAIALVFLFFLPTNSKVFEQQDLIQPSWFWLTWGMLVASILITIYEFWFRDGGKVGYIAHAFTVIFTLLTWQFQLATSDLPVDFKPWIWWQLGLGSLSAGLALRGFFGWFFVVSMPIYWFFFRQQPFSGEPDFLTALQDSIYTFLFSSVVLSTVGLLRLFARRADRDEVIAREALVAEQKARAIEIEKSRIDALLHEKILATLDAALTAENGSQKASVVASAEAALDNLRGYLSSSALEADQISADFLLKTIADLARQQFPDFEVDLSGNTDFSLSHEVLQAFKAATVQAMDNSLRHAGENLVKRKLHLRAKEHGFKIVIEDDGVGFRHSRIPKNCVGIKMVMRGNVESVGGTVKIDTAPGKGCRVILEWVSA